MHTTRWLIAAGAAIALAGCTGAPVEPAPSSSSTSSSSGSAASSTTEASSGEQPSSSQGGSGSSSAPAASSSSGSMGSSQMASSSSGGAVSSSAAPPSSGGASSSGASASSSSGGMDTSWYRPQIPPGCPSRTTRGDNEGLNQHCNGLLEHAELIVPGDTLSGVIGLVNPESNSADGDTFAFWANEGDVFEITVTPTAGSLLLAEWRVWEEEVQARAPVLGQLGQPSTRQMVMLRTGVHHVGVTEQRRQGGAGYGYTLSLRKVTLQPEAVQFPIDSGVRTIGADGVLQAFSFSLPANQDLVLQMAAAVLSPSSSVDAMVVLLDVSDSERVRVAGAARDIDENATDARLEGTLRAGGDFVVVAEFEELGSEPRSYRLTGTATANTTDVQDQVLRIRNAADAFPNGTGDIDYPVQGVVVTHIKPAVAGAGAADQPGFFVQGAPTGPAFFVEEDPAPVRPGDNVSFNVRNVRKNNGVRKATTIANLRMLGRTDLAAFRQDANTVDFQQAANVDAMELEAVTVDGTISGPFTNAGSGYQFALVHTAGNPSGGLRLRVPSDLRNALSLAENCTFSLRGVLWRFDNAPQLSGYTAEDISTGCGGPRLERADSLDATHVQLTFSRNIDPASATAGAFTFDGGLTAAGASVDGNLVVVETSMQAAGTPYTVTVATSVRDTQGNAVELAARTAQFNGFNGCAGPYVVISQVYGGGGGSSSTYAADFVELHNRSANPVSVDGWSLQYAGATGTSWQFHALSGELPAGGYHLIQLVGSGTMGTALPTADSTATFQLGASAGKVALLNNQTFIPAGTSCPTEAVFGLVDLVGYGSADCFEGTVASSPSFTASIRRATAGGAENGCADSGSNAADFASGTPEPHNSASAVNVCACQGSF